MGESPYLTRHRSHALDLPRPRFHVLWLKLQEEDGAETAIEHHHHPAQPTTTTSTTTSSTTIAKNLHHLQQQRWEERKEERRLGGGEKEWGREVLCVWKRRGEWRGEVFDGEERE